MTRIATTLCLLVLVSGCRKASEPDTTPAPPKPGDNDRDASGKIPLRAPDLPPSVAPAGLAVGFGPKELSPTPAREA